MAHYILADDFDFDSIIIKEIDFNLVETKLTLKFTYNDDHILESSVDFGTDFASVTYVDNKVLESLKPYSTTAEVGELIANALQEYDKSSVVTNKINESIADALNEYYTRTEVDNKDNALKEDYIQRDTNVTNTLTTEINKKKVSGVENTFSPDTNTLSTKVYQADGTYQIGIATIPNGSNDASGLISPAQTKKLNSIADGANKYVLPVATENALGGIYAATGDDGYTNEVKIKNGKLYTRPGDYDLPVANATRLGGVKPTATKTSAYTVPVAVDEEGGLFTIPGNYELKVATSDALGGIQVGYTENAKNYAVKVDSNGKAYVTVNWTDTVATISANGLMSASDKSKLDNIESGANKYTLPVATASVLGGVKIGSGINISNGVISAQSYSLPTASASTLGGVKIGTGVKISNGVISLDTDYISKLINLASVKVGDLITMDLGNTASSYGTLHEYRVTKVYGSGIVEVVAMYEPTTSQKFGSSQAYSGSDLDTYLNNTWYNTLSDKAKAAIVDNDINQYKYTYNSSSKTTSHMSYADYSTKALYANVGSRHIYSLDVEDIEQYFGGTGGSASDKTAGTFTLAQLMTLFYKSTATISGKYFWLRSADASSTSHAWLVYGSNGYVYDNAISNTYAVRPAFKIDLSKIDWSVSN